MVIREKILKNPGYTAFPLGEDDDEEREEENT